MTSQPRVSIVVPAYNTADYIAETIESLLAQDYHDLEIIVVDDGSTDATGEILARYDERVRKYRQSNAGQSVAMAVGWSMTSGSIIGYLSADDRLKPSAVRLCVAELVARPATVLVYPDFDVIDAHSRHVLVVRAPDFSRRALYADLHCLPGPGALFRRSAYEKAGPWRTDLRQIPDLDFFLRMGLEGDFYHVPAILADFRKHSHSTTYRAVVFERGEEPLAMVDRFYSRSDLPKDIRGWERQSRANAYLLSAAIHGQSGRAGIAIRRLASSLIAPSAMLSRKALGHAIMAARGALVRR